MKKLVFVSALIIAAFLVGVFASPMLKKEVTPIKKEAAAKKILYWVAPMDPNYRRDKPGKSPMGMDLVPVYAKGHNTKDDATTVTISPNVVNNLGVVSEPVVKERLERKIEAVGYVQADEDAIRSINTYTDGWVRNLRINAVGESVVKGQVLFDLYSPSMIQAQQEYLLALENKKNELIIAAEKKLKTLGFSQLQTKTLRQRRSIVENIPVLANYAGIVSKLAIRDGMYVKPNRPLIMIENLSSVWINVSVYEKSANLVKRGQKAEATFPALPGEKWQGKVEYVYPLLEKLTHTLSVRLKFANPNLMLKPNMYALVSISIPASKETLTVLRSSVIAKGQERSVILDLGNGRFKPQKVHLGFESGDKVSVLSGLKVGQKVVTSGQFLIDSESNLNASFKRMEAQNKKHLKKKKHN